MLTEECNFDCVYCHQRRSSRRMTAATARLAVKSFLPVARNEFFLVFGGGEPLLEFPLIRKIVSHARRAAAQAGKTAGFSITTNGSLIDSEKLDFFRSHGFTVVLSFDGTAQEINRRPGSTAGTLARLRALIGTPGIRLETNSVFTPETVFHLSPTAGRLLDLGVPNINLSLTLDRPWEDSDVESYRIQLDRTADRLLAGPGGVSPIPIVNFRPDSGAGFFTCAAGSDRLSVSPDGSIWGCPMFSDAARSSQTGHPFSDYRLGHVRDRNDWKSNAPSWAAPFRGFTGEFFRTPDQPCFLCPDAGECRICPVTAARAAGRSGNVPGYMCRLQKVELQARRRFRASPKKGLSRDEGKINPGRRPARARRRPGRGERGLRFGPESGPEGRSGGIHPAPPSALSKT